MDFGHAYYGNEITYPVMEGKSKDLANEKRSPVAARYSTEMDSLCMKERGGRV